jgi:formyltetrahydrofolate hydrolase
MARCKHDKGNIQQFTEVCLDCGHNIYESDEEYEKSLRQEIYALRKELKQEQLADLEKTRDELRDQLNKRRGNDDNNSGGW